jgi:DNA-binding CsgD family transcriptional regulator
MLLYTGPYLSVHFDAAYSRISQNWMKSPSTTDDFKSEMLKYTELYDQYRPSQSIWDQQNFQFELTPNDHKWIEKHVNIPCKKYGNKKLAFVVGKNVLAHLQVIGAFENINSCIRPQHFALEGDAIAWLNEKLDLLPGNDTNIEVSYDGVNEEGMSTIRIVSPKLDILEVMKRFDNISAEMEFLDSNKERFSTLTARELDVIHWFSQGLKVKEIAEKLFISHHTVQTHWKSIKKKLEIKSTIDILRYIKFLE